MPSSLTKEALLAQFRYADRHTSLWDSFSSRKKSAAEVTLSKIKSELTKLANGIIPAAEQAKLKRLIIESAMPAPLVRTDTSLQAGTAIKSSIQAHTVKTTSAGEAADNFYRESFFEELNRQRDMNSSLALISCLVANADIAEPLAQCFKILATGSAHDDLLRYGSLTTNEFAHSSLNDNISFLIKVIQPNPATTDAKASDELSDKTERLSRTEEILNWLQWLQTQPRLFKRKTIALLLSDLELAKLMRPLLVYENDHPDYLNILANIFVNCRENLSALEHSERIAILFTLAERLQPLIDLLHTRPYTLNNILTSLSLPLAICHSESSIAEFNVLLEKLAEIATLSGKLDSKLLDGSFLANFIKAAMQESIERTELNKLLIERAEELLQGLQNLIISEKNLVAYMDFERIFSSEHPLALTNCLMMLEVLHNEFKTIMPAKAERVVMRIKPMLYGKYNQISIDSVIAIINTLLLLTELKLLTTWIVTERIIDMPQVVSFSAACSTLDAAKLLNTETLNHLLRHWDNASYWPALTEQLAKLNATGSLNKERLTSLFSLMDTFKSVDSILVLFDDRHGISYRDVITSLPSDTLTPLFNDPEQAKSLITITKDWLAGMVREKSIFSDKNLFKQCAQHFLSNLAQAKILAANIQTVGKYHYPDGRRIVLEDESADAIFNRINGIATVIRFLDKQGASAQLQATIITLFDNHHRYNAITPDSESLRLLGVLFSSHLSKYLDLLTPLISDILQNNREALEEFKLLESLAIRFGSLPDYLLRGYESWSNSTIRFRNLSLLREISEKFPAALTANTLRWLSTPSIEQWESIGLSKKLVELLINLQKLNIKFPFDDWYYFAWSGTTDMDSLTQKLQLIFTTLQNLQTELPELYTQEHVMLLLAAFHNLDLSEAYNKEELARADFFIELGDKILTQAIETSSDSEITPEDWEVLKKYKTILLNNLPLAGGIMTVLLDLNKLTDTSGNNMLQLVEACILRHQDHVQSLFYCLNTLITATPPLLPTEIQLNELVQLFVDYNQSLLERYAIKYKTEIESDLGSEDDNLYLENEIARLNEKGLLTFSNLARLLRNMILVCKVTTKMQQFDETLLSLDHIPDELLTQEFYSGLFASIENCAHNPIAAYEAYKLYLDEALKEQATSKEQDEASSPRSLGR